MSCGHLDPNVCFWLGVLNGVIITFAVVIVWLLCNKNVNTITKSRHFTNK